MSDIGRLRSLIPLMLFVVLPAGCSNDGEQQGLDATIPQQDGTTPATDSVAEGMTRDATIVGDAAGGCQPLSGLMASEMVELPAGFKIDRTEVTQVQYAAWLAAGPDPACQPPQCSWNSSFAPDDECLAGTGMFGMTVCTGSGCEQHPQVCVDWCDAWAYCQGVGKHLCGKIGGGTLIYEEYPDPAKSEWVNACSSGGKHTYVYGDAYSKDTCNDFESGIETTVTVGSLTGCVSSEPGYSGVFDLVGNVSELIDACRDATQAELDTAKQNGSTDTPDMQARCRLGSGSFTGLPEYSTCEADNEANRSLVLGNMGFRCCN